MTREQELEVLITKARESYYGNPLENPEILSDEEYDSLEEELRSLNPDSPILSSVGAHLENEKREKLSAPMLSQEKALSMEDTDRIIKSRFPLSEKVVLTEKLDGCGLDLTYVEGKLVSAITRGTWIEGTQVLQQAMLVSGILHSISSDSYTIKPVIHIRGEVVITFKDFNEINEEQDARKEDRFSNPRNLAAGTIKIEDFKEISRRRLRFVAYEAFAASDIYESPTVQELSNADKLDFLKSLGFQIPVKTQIFDNAEVASKEAYKILSNPEEIQWPIDGIVLKLVNRSLCKALGETTHHPKGSFAIKPLPESAWVTIDHIDWTISRRGILSPTAVFNEVKLSGANISRVMLFNLNNLERFNAYPGTRIKIIRSGLVIPRCIDSDFHAKEIMDTPRQLQPGESKAYIREKGKWAIYDTTAIRAFYPKEFNGNEVEEITFNKSRVLRVKRIMDELDPHVVAKKIEHFLSSIRCLGFGEAILTEYVLNSNVKSVSEFIETLKEDSFTRFIKSRTISSDYSKKLYLAVQKSKTTSQVKDLIRGLGIERAVSIIDKILPSISSFDDIFIRAIWKPNTTPGIYVYIDKDLSANESEYRAILKNFSFINETGNTSTSTILSGHSFVITGTLPVKRSEVEKIIKQNGGLIGSSVSKRTTYLIAGEDCGSKLEAAKKLGVSIISYQEFRDKFGL